MRLVLTVFFVFLCSLGTLFAKEHYRIGILSFRPTEVTLKQWQPMIDYLQQKLPKYSFSIQALSYVEQENAIKNHEIDFLLTNPASYVFFKERHLLSLPFVGLKNLYDGKVLRQFGGVIFTRKDTSNINTLQDLKGKRIATVGTHSLGGYQMQAYELFKRGIDAIDQMEFIFTEMPHDNTVFAVLDKKADVGFARTGVLEALAKAKKIKLSDLKILNQQKSDFPLILSTNLYPEWFFSSLPHVKEQVVLDLSAALLQMPIMKEHKIGGFGIAQDYHSVKNILKEMHFPPFDKQIKERDFSDFVEEFLYEIIIFITLVFAFIIFIVLWLRLKNKTLKENQQNLKMFQGIFENTTEAIVICDNQTNILNVNPAFSAITGYTKAEAIGKKTNLFNSGQHEVDFFKTIWESLGKNGYWKGEIYNKKKGGEIYPEYLSITAIKDQYNAVNSYFALFSDITKIKEQQVALQEAKFFDTLTKLPNRKKLIQEVGLLIEKNTVFTLIDLDIDNFKKINEKYGYEIGDEFLLAFVKRLEETCSQIDFLSRIGGDEFCIISKSFNQVDEIIIWAEHLLHVSAQSFLVKGENIATSVSMGLSFYPQEETISSEKLIYQANQSMNEAKFAGKNEYKFYDTSVARQKQSLHENLQEIQDALRAKEFIVYYQPKINMSTGKLLGFEALVRWQKPNQDILSPACFLPLIEDHPLMIELGEFVLRDTLDLLVKWHKNDEKKDLHISVNLSAYQIMSEDFIQRLQAILSEYPKTILPCLEFEVLETSALEDIQQASRVIDTCKQMGISFSLDDFGTGYSSLTYLKQLDIQTIKIDQSFVREMLNKPENIAILDAIIALSNAFDINLIAEGVETISQGRTLLQLGCVNAQGYFVAKPMPKEDIDVWHKTLKTPEEWSKTKKIAHEYTVVLRAMIEHFRWVDQIISYMENENNTPPVLSHKECNFAKILQADKKFQVLLHPALPKHEILHEKAQKLIDLKNGSKDEIEQKVEELLALAQELQEDIYGILQAS